MEIECAKHGEASHMGEGTAKHLQTPYRSPLNHDLTFQRSPASFDFLKTAVFLRLLDPPSTNKQVVTGGPELKPQSYSSTTRFMERNLRQLSLNTEKKPSESPPTPPEEILEWSWDVEHADRKLEAKADAALHGATPFEVDRRVLKDVVREKMGSDVVRIKFLSAGTFHKAYLVTLADKVQIVARVARRFMPRLKTESEVATMQYLRENTNVPVPIIYHYDSNPYNRLGGEYILMSKARGTPLANVYHSLPYNTLVKLLTNLAEIVIPLFAHRFSDLGSLYFGPNPHVSPTVGAMTPKVIQMHYSAFPFSPTLGRPTLSVPVSPITPRLNSSASVKQEYHIGPIISWPFFGTNRGELVHPHEINRGPWSSTKSYLESCAEREVQGVIRENEGKSAPHKLHLDPDEIISSRHHHMKAVPGDESDESDEWDLEESEEEWEGPGDIMYRDYRRMQRTTFLVAHMQEREECVKKEMARWLSLMNRLLKHEAEKGKCKNDGMFSEEFGLDCHDLSLENVFVDETDPSKITCIIDWESTTTRPLWACAHLPAFLQSSPFVGKIFRDIVAKMATVPTPTPASASATPTIRNGFKSRHHDVDLAALANEWLQYEASGMRLRMAHRFVEWDGWEEGLVNSMLGEEEHEDDWFKDSVDYELTSPPLPGSNGVDDGGGGDGDEQQSISGVIANVGDGGGSLGKSISRRKASSKLPFAKEMEKEQMLDTTGDICGGRGGELGRRLEAWLTVNGHEDVSTHEPVVGPRRRWHNDEDED